MYGCEERQTASVRALMYWCMWVVLVHNEQSLTCLAVSLQELCELVTKCVLLLANAQRKLYSISALSEPLLLSLASLYSKQHVLHALWNGRYSLAPITTDLESSPSVSPYVYSHRTCAGIKRRSLQMWFVNLTCKRRLTCCLTCWATMYSTDATLYDCVLTHWHTPLGIVPDCLYRTICLCLIQSVTHNRYSRSTHNFVTLLFL